MKFEMKGIFVKTLLIILAMSFVLFGIINFFSGVGNSNILKINSQKVSLIQFSRFLTEKRNQLFNADLSNDEVEFLNSKNFINLSLSEFAGNLLFQNKIEELNFVEPREVVVDEIYNSPNFKNASGSFDLELFKNILNTNNLTEDGYIQYMLTYNSKNNLLQILTLKSLSNNFIIKENFKKENIYVKVDVIIAKPNQLDSNKEYLVSEASIKEYYENNKDDFVVPETKVIAYTDINLSKYKIGEAKEKLSSLEDLILSAKNIDEITKKFNSKKEIIRYNSNLKIIPDDLSKEVLDYSEGTFSDLIYKDNSIYRVYYIEKVIPMKLLSLNEASQEIHNILEQRTKKENELLSLERILKQFKLNDIKKIALRNNLELKENITIYKDSVDYPDEFLSILYKTKVNAYTNPIFDSENNVYMIGFVKSIKNIPSENTNFTSQQILDSMWNRSYKNSIIKIFDKYLFDSNKIIVNNKVLNSLK
jgi:hypothetical protein